ncbi:L-ornithine N5-oxygenase [Sinosporangium album]|uniref:L-lysine N6-monooxygenase MbtG n=1 Tax=Sinosporangium album TaxID=504805 RepID=A0A1G8HMX7_9ACTN|nr:lysine N(6)-hydroxylase/L-ornithine N(5)-oxygenase family protein [Sinosporangium album]SDI08029.1 L-ornithine N5-oxygenase [Sinosporangium album]
MSRPRMDPRSDRWPENATRPPAGSGPRDHGKDPLDVIGIGFGPSNLALAIALREHGGGVPGREPTSAFAEQQQTFGWHRGMLLDGATMQVSFLKDLATLRNPTSAFSFLNYLHARGRLVDFINHKTLFPTRVEFHDYLTWAAERFTAQVAYGTRVTDLRPVKGDGGDVVAVEVIADGELLGRARNIVLGLGLRPYLPEGVHASERVWHNGDLLTRLRTLPVLTHRRFAVVGAGQSAAEVVDHLHRAYPDAEVCAVFSRYGYSPADDSAFANRIFDPSAVDDFYTAPDEVKASLLSYHGNTNYSVVDIDLIDELYRRSYQENVAGAQRLRILNTSRVEGFDRVPDGVRVRVDRLTTGERVALECDALIFATGYRPPDPLDVLGELTAFCHIDERGLPKVGRDYRIVTDPALKCGIYLQGGTEHTHGLSSSLLSNAAVRAGEIVRSILAHRAG